MTSRNILIAAAVCLVLAIGFYFLFYSPLDDQEQAVTAQTQALRDQRDQLRNQLVQLQDIRDNELQIRADLNRLRALIPSGEPAQPSFVRSVQLAADASGVSVESLTFGEPVAFPDAGGTTSSDGLVLSQISIDGVVEGGYFQLVDLFRRMEIEVVRAVQVDTLSLAEGTDGFPTLSMSFTGRIFAVLPVLEIPTAPPVTPGSDAPADGAASEAPTEGASAEASS